MVVIECKYNVQRDIKPVESFGFVDLKSAFVNNTVPSRLPESETDYNGIEDPSTIVGKPGDVFDALRAADVAESASKEESD